MNNISSARNGWRAEETALLLKEAQAAREGGEPLRQVFNRVAGMTGRKPNSIRNYYYLKAKEEGFAQKAAFVPFTESEVKTLIRDLLIAQGKGESVRAATMRMGGDKSSMLRLQNKYRSVIKLKPELVREIMAELGGRGEKYFDPYTERTARGRKPARAAEPEDLSALRLEVERLSQEQRELLAREKSLQTQMQENSERLQKLCSMINHVFAINRDFMELNGISGK